MSVTKRAGSAGPPIVLCAVLALTPVAVDSPLAQRPEPVAHGVFDGDTMFTVLPPNAIPAVTSPEFVSGEEAAAQMELAEPILGVVVGGEAKAYSLWHLDTHEVVNDKVGGVPIAATW